MHSESSWGVVWVAELPTGLGAMNRCRSQWRNRGVEPGWRSSPGQRRVSVLVRQILGATTRWSPAGGCDGAARVGKAKAAAAGRRIGPGPKELPHPTDGDNPQNSRKNPPSPSEDSSMDPSVPSHDLIPTIVEKSKQTKPRLTFFEVLGIQITNHPSIQRFPQLSRPPRNHRHAQRCQQRPTIATASPATEACHAARAGRSGASRAVVGGLSSGRTS